MVAREILASRNWRNLPMLGALLLLLVGNLLVHLDAIGASRTAEFGNRLGVAVLLMLISFLGRRITPSFTSNWLAKQERDTAPPATFDRLDRTVLAVIALARRLGRIARATARAMQCATDLIAPNQPVASAMNRSPSTL